MGRVNAARIMKTKTYTGINYLSVEGDFLSPVFTITRTPNRIVALAKKVKEYRDTTDCTDQTFLSKIDDLLGSILALEKK
jgi:hypothetical protein